MEEVKQIALKKNVKTVKASPEEVFDGFKPEKTHRDDDNDRVFPEKTGVFTLNNA